MKVLLINPPMKMYEKSQDFSLYFPIGLMSLATMVKDICKIEIFDTFLIEDEKRKTNPFKEISKKIKKYQPDIVGIATPFSSQSENSIKIAKISKKINPKTKIIFGGPDASVRYEYLLKNTPCDYCFIGEAEESFREFIEKFKAKKSLKKIPGIAYQDKNKINFTPRELIKNLDSLPFPAYDLIDMKKYLKNKNLYKNRSEIHKNSISMITSRGCPYNCVFCSIKLHMGQMYRANSPEYVLEHIKLLRNKYGIKNFHFEDDNFSLDKKRFEKILDGIIKEKLNIKWDTPNGIRADTLDLNLLKKIKKSGCNKLVIAIESGSQRVLDEVIRKKTSLKYMIKIAKLCKKVGIRTSAFYVVGFPGETKEEMKKTVNLAIYLLKNYDVFPSFMLATPLYGTELYEICKNNNYIPKNLKDKDLANATQIYGTPLIETEEFTRKELKKIAEDYLKKLKRELIFYTLRNPIFATKKILKKLPVAKKFFN